MVQPLDITEQPLLRLIAPELSTLPPQAGIRVGMAGDQWTLKPHPTISTPSRDHPLLVCVLDGWGEAPDAEDNAIYKVRTDKCMSPHSRCMLTSPHNLCAPVCKQHDSACMTFARLHMVSLCKASPDIAAAVEVGIPFLPRSDCVALPLDATGDQCRPHFVSRQADTPTLDALRESRPERWRLVKAHGTAVGLPTDDDMGNSEVRFGTQ